jgi:hypothetical protein
MCFEWWSWIELIVSNEDFMKSGGIDLLKI